LRVTGHTGRLAVRHSAAAIPNQLIEALDMPLIATSANVSGQPTCQSGFQVLGTMDGRIDLLLDAGTVNGPGATTVDITEPEWRVIKEGAVSRAEIAENLHI
jgi:L-threonylcarbamoyladenylate synthase